MEDKDAFADALSDVTPLRTRERVSRAPVARATPGMEQRRRAATADTERDLNPLSTDFAPPVGPHDIVGFVRPGIQHGVYGKLRRGRYEPEATLDLHRRSLEQARTELWQFAQECVRYQLRTVLVLPGKGDRSPRSGVLKSFVCHWLRDVPEVLAYHSAQPWHGGAGALYVLLRKSPRAREDNRERYLNRRHD